MPTTVTTSTSVVLVATSSNTPPYIVLLPNISTIGRIITVRDNDGFASLANNILLSTTAGAIFSDGTNSISINQPYGFITFNTNPNGVYYILNTFAFPAGQAAANVSNLTASSITTRQIFFTDIATPSTNSIYTSSSILYLNSTAVGEVTASNLTSTVNGLGSSGYLSSIAAVSPSVWVAVGRPSSIIAGSTAGSAQYSTDSFTWVNATGGFFGNGGNSVAYADGLFVAVGDNNDNVGPNLGYNKWSIDGSNWNNSTTPSMSFDQYRTQVNYNNGLWHSVGANPYGGPRTIQWSTDGKTWNDSLGYPFPSGGGISGFATGITYGNGLWVASGFCESFPGAGVIWSSDGSNWSNATSVSWTGSYINGVAFNGSRFVCLPLNGTNPSSLNIAYSTDGKSWSSSGITGGNLNNGAGQVSGNGTIWLITSGGGAPNQGKYLIYSTDALTWNSTTTFSLCNATTRLTDPYYDGATWWVGLQNDSNAQAIFYSGNGISWNKAGVTSRFISSGFPNSFAVKPGQSNNNILLVSAITGVFQQISTSVTTNVLTVSTINMTGNVTINAGGTRVAIGNGAGSNTQGLSAIAIGSNAGQTNQGSNAIAIGERAGNQTQSTNAIAIGIYAGQNRQGISAVAIGAFAGSNTQGQSAVAIGNGAGSNVQGINSIAIGSNAGQINQSTNAIAIGALAGKSNQSTNTIVLNASGVELNTTLSNAFFVKPIRNFIPVGTSMLFYSLGSGEITYGPPVSTFTGLTTGTLSNTNTLVTSNITITSGILSVSRIDFITGVSITAAGTRVAIGCNAGVTNQGDYSVAIGAGPGPFGGAGQLNQGGYAVAIGGGAGIGNQGGGSVAIGPFAAQNTQGGSSVAIGSSAGSSSQGSFAVAIGYLAAQTNQSDYAIAIGISAGRTNQGFSAVAIGYEAGAGGQGSNAIAIGSNAGSNVQGRSAIAIGILAARNAQGINGIAIGSNAGGEGQHTNAIAIGESAGAEDFVGRAQSTNAIAIGKNAGKGYQGPNAIAIGEGSGGYNNNISFTGQGSNAVAIGTFAGSNQQGISGLAIGYLAGQSSQGLAGVAIGSNAGNANQATNAIAIGSVAGQNNQSTNAIAIGRLAGTDSQYQAAIAIGAAAGNNTQRAFTIGIGYWAGNNNQQQAAIAIGTNAGCNTQSVDAVAIGNSAGNSTQGRSAVAIGVSAGQNNQGSNAIAIGNSAGQTNQSTNTIVLNASGTALNTSVDNAFFVKPVRSQTFLTGQTLGYNSTTSEIVYGVPSSDRRIKKNIETANLNMCYSTMRSLPLKFFEWNFPIISTLVSTFSTILELDENASTLSEVVSTFFISTYTSTDVQDKRSLGYIAQDVEEIFPKSIFKVDQYGYDDFKGLDTDQIVKMHYGATQKTMEIIDTQSTLIGQLEGQISTINSSTAPIYSTIETQSTLIGQLFTLYTSTQTVVGQLQEQVSSLIGSNAP